MSTVEPARVKGHKAFTSKLIIVGWLIGAGGGFVLGYFAGTSSNEQPMDIMRCVNALGISVDGPIGSECDENTAAGTACTGPHGSGKCQSTAS